MQLANHCKQLLKHEQTLFQQEYSEYYLEGETKPKEVGEPYFLHSKNSPIGILLIHGLMAAPEEVRQWAESLHSEGYTVYAPRMAGHGTSAIDLSQRKAEEWISSVDRGHEILKSYCKHVVVAGFSTGAAIALQQAIQKPNDFVGVVSISAPLKLKKFSSHFAEPVNSWNKLLGSLGDHLPNPEQWQKEFVTNHADNPEINYHRCPVSSIVQIKQLMKEVNEGLSSITIPSLIMHANQDPKVEVNSARDIFKSIGSSHKRYHEIDFDLHGIVRGKISTQVFREVNRFLLSILSENVSA